MNEKEKMLAGELYNPMLDGLPDERTHAKKMCYEYNQLSPEEKDEKKALIMNLFGKTGKSFTIEPFLQCDYGYNIEIGENFYSNHNLVILDCMKVRFGNNVFIGPNCGFYTAEHPIDYVLRNSGVEFAKPISVGNNVWIGGNVTVIGGVTIGDNVVIGAGSVVTKDIPSNTVAAGNPCKILKNL